MSNNIIPQKSQRDEENTKRLNYCSGPHDFSIVLDPITHKPIRERVKGARFQCTKCGGHVNGSMRHMYMLGLKHGTAQAAREALTR